VILEGGKEDSSDKVAAQLLKLDWLVTFQRIYEGWQAHLVVLFCLDKIRIVKRRKNMAFVPRSQDKVMIVRTRQEQFAQ